MAEMVTWTGLRFAVPLAGFDSNYRYLRQKSGGALTVNAGRTWTVGTVQVNSGQPWVAFRFNNGITSINVVSTTVGSSSQNGSCIAVNPLVETCAMT